MVDMERKHKCPVCGKIDIYGGIWVHGLHMCTDCAVRYKIIENPSIFIAGHTNKKDLEKIETQIAKTVAEEL